MILLKKNLKEIQSDLGSRLYSMSDLVTSYLEQTKQHNALNIYIEIYEDAAKSEAARLDQKIKNGEKLDVLFL
jgi:Asp-tRNA(Asn)/Glu-tRNA(Gln) amidotransferase A subunit family amidase